MAESLNYTSATVVRNYEIVSVVLVLVGLFYVWRTQNPVFAGVYLASSLGGGVMEWIFDSKWYFRLTVDEKFIPAWKIAGETGSLAMILFYGFFYGIPLVVLRNWKDTLYRNFGRTGTGFFVLALGVFGTPVFECFNTSVMHIYKYHQREEYLIWGMPYSNLWFGGLMMFLPFWGLQQVEVLVGLIPRTNTTLLRQKLLGAGIGFSIVISAFFVAATLNAVWYAQAGDIWTPTSRAF